MKLRTREQLSRRYVKCSRKDTKALKQQTSRVWRKMAREDPEGAPMRRPIRGWND